MQFVPIPCCDDKKEKETPKIFSFRRNYKAGDKSLKITVPPGIIEFQWTPKDCDDNYWLDECACGGSFAAVQGVIYYDNRPLEDTDWVTITLPPGSAGQLAYRALSGILPEVTTIDG
jgi:hypothetical protein